MKAMGYYLAFINHTWNVSMQDPLLKELVAMANSGTWCDISLHTPTGIISGTMISQMEYFEHISSQIADAWPGGPNEDMRDVFLDIGRQLDTNEEAANSYVHLRGALVVGEQGFTPREGEGPYWRGKVDSVTGFSLAKFVR